MAWHNLVELPLIDAAHALVEALLVTATGTEPDHHLLPVGVALSVIDICPELGCPSGLCAVIWASPRVLL